MSTLTFTLMSLMIFGLLPLAQRVSGQLVVIPKSKFFAKMVSSSDVVMIAVPLSIHVNEGKGEARLRVLSVLKGAHQVGDTVPVRWTYLEFPWIIESTQSAYLLFLRQRDSNWFSWTFPVGCSFRTEYYLKSRITQRELRSKPSLQAEFRTKPFVAGYYFPLGTNHDDLNSECYFQVQNAPTLDIPWRFYDAVRADSLHAYIRRVTENRNEPVK